MTLHAAWKMDKVGASASRDEIAMIKYYGRRYCTTSSTGPSRTHGRSLFHRPALEAITVARAAIYDGPDEVHRQTVARHALKNYTPSESPLIHPHAHRGGREKLAAC